MDRLEVKEQIQLLEGRIKELLDKIMDMQGKELDTSLIEKTLYTNLKVLKAINPHNLLLDKFRKDHPQYVF